MYKRMLTLLSTAIIHAMAMGPTIPLPAPSPMRAPEPRSYKTRGPDTPAMPKSMRRKKGRRHKYVEFGGKVDSYQRRRFIEAHDRNPLNFLPGAIVHNLYRAKGLKTQAALEQAGRAALDDLIARGYRPKPGYVRASK